MIEPLKAPVRPRVRPQRPSSAAAITAATKIAAGIEATACVEPTADISATRIVRKDCSLVV